ncbi:nuclear transport factor 2-like protein [Ekhidna lutea]|nr:nuclear transport factor 2 family protein [Ekhidna lutea]
MKHLLVLLFCLIVSSGYSQMSHQDSLAVIVDEYYRLNVKIFQRGSTKAEIDSLFNLFSEDFTYNHPKYGGTYSKQTLYDGYINNQKNGRYNGSIADIKITNRIIGLNAVSAEKKFIKYQDGKLAEGEPQMTLFEFKEGKIHRIHEFW